MIDFKKAIAMDAALEASLSASAELRDNKVFQDLDEAVDTILILYNKIQRMQMVLARGIEGDFSVKMAEAALK